MNRHEELLMLRGLTVEEACPECDGLGVKSYANTTTWRGGIGGQAITNDVCDECWGSGSRYNTWPSHREFLQMRRKCDENRR